MEQNKKSTLAAVLVIFISLVLLGLFKYQQSAYEQKLQKAQTELATEQKALKQAKKQEQRKLREKAATGTAAQQDSAKQAKAENDASTQAAKLFKILFTYSSQADWAARSTQAKSLVTDTILNDKTYFNDGKDDTGNSIIDTMKLQSSFISADTRVSLINEDANTVDCVSVVKYAAQYGSERSATTTVVYTSTYDLNQQKFTKLQKLGTTMVDATTDQ